MLNMPHKIHHYHIKPIHRLFQNGDYSTKFLLDNNVTRQLCLLIVLTHSIHLYCHQQRIHENQ